MKASLSTGDVAGAQACWQSAQESISQFIGQPRLRSSPTRAASGNPSARWSSDDLLRLPARVVSGVNEPMMRYSLPRKHTLRSGAAAHLGGGHPSAVTASIHGDGGRMAVERRVPDGYPPKGTADQGDMPAPTLASDLGWTVPSLSQILASDDARTRSSRSLSQLHESSPFVLDRRSVTDSWTEKAARSPKQHGASGGAGAGASGGGGRLGHGPSRARARGHVFLNPSRRDIATGAAVAPPPPHFDINAVRVVVEPVELSEDDLPPSARANRLPLLRSYLSGGAALHEPAPADPLDERADVTAAADAERTLRALGQQQMKLEREERYMEADAVRMQAGVLAAAEQQRKRDALVARQLAQRAAAEAAHSVEVTQLGQRWQLKQQHFDTQALTIEEELAHRHARESEELRARMAALPSARPASNRELLDLRASEARFATGDKYGDAAEARSRAAILEAQQSERMRQGRDAAAVVASRQLAQQQAAENAAFELRVKTGRAQHKAQRAHDFAQLHRRFQNVLSELDAQHRAERVRLERAERLQAIRFGPTASNAGQRTAKPQPPGEGGAGASAVTSSITVQPTHRS